MAHKLNKTNRMTKPIVIGVKLAVKYNIVVGVRTITACLVLHNVAKWTSS